MSARGKRNGTEASPDAASDKSILENGHGKIIKTEEIAIQFGERGDAGSVNYEMHDFGNVQHERSRD